MEEQDLKAEVVVIKAHKVQQEAVLVLELKVFKVFRV
jgi:hypothetical protein